MFKDDIIIQGGPFTDSITYEGILSKRMNLVYGRNGSGKSSIARAFREQQAGQEQKDYRLSFDGSGSLPDTVRDHLFVFNEDFIDGSVKFSLRAKEPDVVSDVAQAFGGGGHPQAAGITLYGKLDEVTGPVLEAMIRKLNG